ncbi:MAG: hypothetical protein JXA11_10825 [Phycisphaerae bacterium]|nr:hypothetical protein [Phycisphaerae bacterium]
MTRQNIVAMILLSAAVLLLVRHIYRLYTGKTTGCSCDRKHKASEEQNNSD